MGMTSDFDEAAVAFYRDYYGQKRFFEQNQGCFFSHGEKTIAVCGDVCFNLKKEYRKKHSTLYGSIIKNDKDYDALYEQLGILAYSPMNISIMPRTGELNNTKKSIGDDRFDTFAWMLHLYYEGFQVPVINAGTRSSYITNRIVLRDFLNSYGSVAEYFYDFYGLDRKFVDEQLVKNGQRTITDREDLFNYIKLAVSFWKKRMDQEKIRDYFEKNRRNDEKKIYGKTMDEIEDILQKWE